MAVSSSYSEPSVRFYHAAVGFDRNMFLWAGTGSAVSSSVVHSFNAETVSWGEQRELSGQLPPDGWCGMAVACDRERAYGYFFGGIVGPKKSCAYRNTLYALDLLSMQCREIVPTNAAPSGREHSAMVYYKKKLVVYGGQAGAAAVFDDLFVFDLKTSEALH